MYVYVCILIRVGSCAEAPVRVHTFVTIATNCSHRKVKVRGVVQGIGFQKGSRRGLTLRYRKTHLLSVLNSSARKDLIQVLIQFTRRPTHSLLGPEVNTLTDSRLLYTTRDEKSLKGPLFGEPVQSVSRNGLLAGGLIVVVPTLFRAVCYKLVVNN